MKSILIVDDNASIREALRIMLKSAGYKPSVAVNGMEALQKIRQTHYDLITMDMSMAEMDGVDAISVIRNEADTPIVVISAFLTDPIRKELRARDVEHFLEKPFTLSEVLKIIKDALEKK